MAKFAEGTTVSPSKTQVEIATLVERYGATQFSSGWTGDQAAISFAAKGRLVRFVIQLPSVETMRATMSLPRGVWNRSQIKAETVAKCREQEVRRLWRCLLLAIKAKLEVVESGIATFDEEFLAHIVTDNKMTIFERLKNAESGQRLLTEVK
jgi:hypothetical protein